MTRKPTPKSSSALPSVSLKHWVQAATRLPGLSMTALTWGALPAGVDALKTARREGTSELHYKVLGDALVRFFQRSGPVLTKIGQILATRSDLLPPALCKRLEALYDRQPAMPAAELKRLLRKAYPKGLPFEEFVPEPIGVGSVGQVHRASLKDGSPVVVKFVRPGARQAIERDIATAFAVTSALFAVLGRDKETSALMTRKVLEDLETGFLSELDLEAEAASIRRFRDRLKSNPNIYIPRCHDELCGAHVLVIEELKGTPLSKVREASGGDSRIGKRAADIALKEILTQIFDEGRFHADPHAGNLMMLDDGRIGLIDFGLTGEFTKNDRRRIARAVKAFLARDADAMIGALLEFGTAPPGFDLPAFKAEIVKVAKSRKNLGAANLEALVNELFGVAFRHRIYVPQSTTLLIKTLVTIEGVARSLDPEINLVTVAVPVILRSLTPKWLRVGDWFRSRG